MRFLLVAGLADSLINFRGPLIAELQRAGATVHVAAPNVGSDVRGALESRGVRVHEIPLRRAGTSLLDDFGTFFSLVSLMRAVRPQYFLGYTIKPVIYGSLAAWIVRVPNRFAMITGLGYTFQGNGRERGLLRALVERLYRTALKKVQVCFFQNPDDRDLFLSRALVGASTRTVVINGSGVDVTAFPLVPYPKGDVTFLLIGRLLGDKGVREYVAAARRIKDRHPFIRFLLVGWIDENPDAISESELAEWQETGVVDFLGRLNDVKPAIELSSVYVLPSYREGTPRTVLEAMAMGRPVITTDAPGCRETVLNGENGFLVDVKSVDALEEAMIRFIERPILIETMGARARQMAEEKYDVRKVNAHLLHEMGVTWSDDVR